MTILICDDDREIAKAIEIYLKAEGYSTLLAFDGRQALELIEAEEIDLIIMDVMMPIMDGHTATVKIRETYNVPIIILSAKTEDTDKVLGLNVGADDYVTKPFNALELVARVKSQLRRYNTLGGAAYTDEDKVLATGAVLLNDSRKQVMVEDTEVHLTPTEYKILKLLMSNLGQVFSSDQIYRQVWGEDPYLTENTVAVHVRRIREKIEINPKEPRYLKVVWGIGYKMEKVSI